MTESRDERDLIAACLRGDLESFGEIVRLYQDRLYNVAYRFLGNHEDARDVVQEAFLSAFQALPRFKGNARFFTWLYRIAMNHAVDFRRKQRSILRLERQPERDVPGAADARRHHAGESLERQEENEKIRRALEYLSLEHRMVLVLKDIDDMKYEDIAEVLDVPIGTVRSRLHRARLELRHVWDRMESMSDSKH